MKSSLRVMGVILLSILLAVFLTACGGGGDGDGGNGNGGGGAATYTASGTYTYDPGTSILTLNVTSSDFECEGPEVGTEEISVTSITSTTMIWDDEDPEGQRTWTRESGTSGDIVGTWESSNGETGNSWEATFESNGSFSVVGSIVQCNDGGDGDGNGGDITMPTPYANESDMAAVYNAFSSNDSAPWGFAHPGVDFSPNGDVKPFQAVCSGKVGAVDLFQNSITSTWQVNVRIICNSTYAVEYAFEPMTTVQSDGQTQMANILVSVDQTVTQGDPIGYLFSSAVGGQDAHVHFTFMRNWDAICPEPYFTQEAKDSILRLIRIIWPGANMCY